jgi:hypothetical protein
MIYQTNSIHVSPTRGHSRRKRMVFGIALIATPFISVGVASAQSPSTTLGASTTKATNESTTSSASSATAGPSTTIAAAESTISASTTASSGTTETTSLLPTSVDQDETVSATDITIDDAVPQGGIDAGFGGAAPEPDSSGGVSVPFAALLFSGAAAVGVAAGRRSRR